jgi:hypothetical protein
MVGSVPFKPPPVLTGPSQVCDSTPTSWPPTLDRDGGSPESPGEGDMSISSTTKQYVAAGTLLLAGTGAGALLAVTSTASAEDGSGAAGYGATATAPEQGERRERPASAEEPLTGNLLTQVTAAVEAEYPEATIERVETDAGGVYEAHLTTADGERLTVLVDEDFVITGTEEGGMRGGPCDGDGNGDRRGHGGPRGEADTDTDSDSGSEAGSSSLAS